MRAPILEEDEIRRVRLVRHSRCGGGSAIGQCLRILTGQTASGKSGVALCLAKAVGAEIISVDSMKVYRGLDIGTAKPSPSARSEVPFHLVDIVAPQDTFTLVRYLDLARAAAEEIESRGRFPLFVGGTPLYLRGLIYGIFEGPGADWALRKDLEARARRDGPEALHAELRRLDPRAADRLHPNDLKRVIRAIEVASLTGRPISEQQRQYPAPAGQAALCRMAALRRGDEDLRARIRKRVRRMFDQGFVEEVRRVLAEGPLSRTAEKAIGYAAVADYINGRMSLDECMDAVERQTWRLARKQRTWLKSFPDVRWVDARPDEPAEETAERARDALFGAERLN